MARGPRRDAGGCVHHVMLRGIERGAIFRDRCDFEDFASRLARLIPDTDVRCLAWCLLPNHVHLVLEVGTAPLSRLISRLATGHAIRFNNRHGRVGHVFQNRFRSRPIESEEDRLGVIVYVAANPIRHGIVSCESELREYPWSGYAALVGAAPARAFESPDATLAHFGPDVPEARQSLRRRVAERAWAHGGLAPDPSPSELPTPFRPQRSHGVHGRGSFDGLVESVCSRRDVGIAELHQGARRRAVVRARAEVALRASQELGLTGRDIAQRLGVSESAVSQMLRASAGLAREDLP